MASPLEGSLARTIGSAMGTLFYACSLVRETRETGSPYTPFNPGPAVETNYPCKGIVDTYSLRERESTLIQAGDVKVLILSATLSETPAPDDKVAIRGVTYNVISVDTDPATAVWVLQCRK